LKEFCAVDCRHAAVRDIDRGALENGQSSVAGMPEYRLSLLPLQRPEPAGLSERN